MRALKYFILTLVLFIFSSCGSIKSTLKNIDNTAVKPAIKENYFILTEVSTDKKYGYDQDYPINLGFENETKSQKNVDLFFNALTGKNGEKISYNKAETCCPFPTKRNAMGAGSLDIYQIRFEGNANPIQLYINVFEKGKVLCPVGFSIKR